VSEQRRPRVRKRLSIPLFLCAGLLIYATVSPAPRVIQLPTSGESETEVAEAYAVDVTVTDFNESGVLQSTTQARRLRRYRDGARLELDEPVRRSFGDDGSWIASAQRGAFYEDCDVLELRDNARLRYPPETPRMTDNTQAAHPSKDPLEELEFATAALTINIAARTAESPSPVRIWQGPNETRAQSMFIELDKQLAQLSGGVSSVYVPES
jgi:LPS export ABC transporter protein LptC